MTQKLRRIDHDADVAAAARGWVSKIDRGGADHVALAAAVSMLHQYSSAFWPCLTEKELGKLKRAIPAAGKVTWFINEPYRNYGKMIQEIIDWCRNPEYLEQ